MIVVDTSALIAILKNEPQADACLSLLATADRVLIAAPTLTEALIVSRQKGFPDQVDRLLAQTRLEIVPFDETWARRAAAGYQKFGRKIHPAELNYGDSFSYALAREFNCPLLFVGNDFSRTDVTPDLASQHG